MAEITFAGFDFERQMRTQGWALFPSVIPPGPLAAIRREVLQSVNDCARRQVQSGATTAPDGTAHHAVGQYQALDNFLEQAHLHREITQFFDGAPYILHAFNPASVQPARTSYLHRIHRDVRTHASGFRFMLNMLVMVDPFTTANGATHVLSGSQVDPDPPSEESFHTKSERLTGPAGSIVLFDSNLWHAAGSNTTDTVRTALTLSYSRAFVKQQMDYPRFLSAERAATLSPHMRQILGYHARVPATYEEFYQPAAARFYQAQQG